MAALPSWAELEPHVPAMVATMRRYLTQIGCILRPRSVTNTDQALRAFAGFLVQTAPEVTTVGQITRRHVEDYKPWLAARPGQNKPRVTTATLAHRLGTLRMFFVRIDEWGWDEAPPRVPMFPGDLPRQDHPLPKALDDAAAAKLLRAAQNDTRLLVRVTVEVLLRTGLRVSEYTGLRADAVVLIGAAPWLHVPVGKLRDDRYLPLHPNLVTLIDEYRTRYVPVDHPLLLPRENGRPLDRHTVTRMINKAGEAAGLPHIHPHQLRHTLATQAINRGMSLEAIAAMLGHRSLDMTLRYAKIANRTVADEYFAVTDKVEALYGQHKRLPTDAIGPKMARLRREHHRLLGNGYCTRPAELDCAFESICENCAFFQTSIEFRPTLQAQRDHADARGQTHRAQLFNQLIKRIDHQEAS
jgi:site-specific recombinase XerD